VHKTCFPSHCIYLFVQSMLTMLGYVSMVADSYCRQQCMELGKLNPQQQCQHPLWQSRSTEHQHTWSKKCFHSLSSSFLIRRLPYVKKLLSGVFFSFARIAWPLISVMYMHMQIVGSVLQMQSHQGWNFAAQETDQEIQRWISVVHYWLQMNSRVICCCCWLGCVWA
jgi:hypothetical protein